MATRSIAERRSWPASSARQIASANVTVIDDGTMPGGFGTAPFDGEGIPTRRTVVIENGILKSYLLNTYTAKKLRLKPPPMPLAGWLARPASRPEITFLQPGRKRRSRLSREIKDGLYVTEFLGHGANLVTGDYSRGASGSGSSTANWLIRSKRSRLPAI